MKLDSPPLLQEGRAEAQVCYKGKLFSIVACYYEELDVLPSSHYTAHGMSVALWQVQKYIPGSLH